MVNFLFTLMVVLFCIAFVVTLCFSVASALNGDKLWALLFFCEAMIAGVVLAGVYHGYGS